MNMKLVYAIVCGVCGTLILGVGMAYGANLPVPVTLGIFAIGGTAYFSGVVFICEVARERVLQRQAGESEAGTETGDD